MDALQFFSNFSLRQYLVGCIAALWISHIWMRVYHFCICQIKLLKASKNFPGPPALPLLGNGWEFATNLEGAFDVIVKISEKYPICRVWIGPKLFIVISRPKDIEKVMKSDETSKKSFVYDLMKPVFVNTLLNGHGPEMRAHRKLLVPLINGEYLVNYMESFNNQILRSIDTLMKKMGTKEFDIYEEMKYCMADIAFETIFGIPGVAQDHGDLTIPHAAETAAEVIFHRAVTPWLHPSLIFRLSKCGATTKMVSIIMHGFVDKLIEEKRKLHTALARGDPTVEKPKPSILDLWIENVVRTNAMSDKEIADDLIILFIGFYDTILGMFSFILLMLAMHSDIQEKVREEVMTVMGTAHDVTEEHIGKLFYTGMTIKEAMRLFPIGPVIPREVTDDLKLDDYTLPKGSTVAMIAAVTHRSKEYWDEPAKFIPERFLPENSKGRHPYAYIPFSGGSRSCPGSKFGMTCLKVMVAQMIRKYQLTTNMKLESLKLRTHVSVRSRDGYRVSMKKIECL